ACVSPKSDVPKPTGEGFLSQRPAPTVTIGLTESPQAFCVSAHPAATSCSNRRKPSRSMLCAAFRSRSCWTPQGHVQSRSAKVRSALTRPHSPQVLEDGKNRPITIKWVSARSALYVSIERNLPHPASRTLFASLVFARPDTFKSSIDTRWLC